MIEADPVVADWAYASVAFTILVYAMALGLRQCGVLPIIDEHDGHDGHDNSVNSNRHTDMFSDASVSLSGFPTITQSEQMPLSR